jgi:O-antigen/teichoic acid export membrane protein
MNLESEQASSPVKYWLNSMIYIGATVIEKSLSFFMLLFYTDYITTEELGIATVILSISTIYELIFRFSVDEAFARFWFDAKNKDDKSKILFGTAAIMVMAGVIGLVLLLLLNKILIVPFLSTKLPYKYILLCALFSIQPIPYNVLLKKLRIEERAKAYGACVIVASAVFVGSIYVFVIRLGMQSFGYLLAYEVKMALMCFVSLVMIFYGQKLKPDKNIIKELLAYALPIMPHLISTWGMSYVNRIIIGLVVDLSAVGIYNTMNTLGTMVAMLSIAVMYVFQPWVYRELEKGQKAEKSIKKYVAWATSAFTLVGLCLSMIIPELVHCFINASYWSGIPLVSVIIASSNLAFMGNMITYIMYYDKSLLKYVSLTTFCGAIVNILLTYFMGKYLGVMGAAVAYLISHIFTTEMKRVIIIKKKQMNVLYISQYALALAAGITGSLCGYYDLNLIIRIAIVFVVAFAYLIWYREPIEDFWKGIKVKKEEQGL